MAAFQRVPDRECQGSRSPRRAGGLIHPLYNCTIISMDLVIDTSAIIAVIANEPERPAIVEHTIGANLVAPASVHWEVGNAFSAMFKRRRITLRQAEQAIESYEQMPIRFVDVDLGQSLELCDRLGVYAYDSYLLTCALKLRSPFSLSTNNSSAPRRWSE